MQGPTSSSWTRLVLSLLRIAAALSFITHGTQKLFAMPVLQPRDPVALMSLAGLAGVLELVGGSFLLLGLFARPIAFLLSGEMAVAYFMSHAPRSFFPVLNAGEPSMLYCFIWLYVSAAGPGPLSIDALLRRKKK